MKNKKVFIYLGLMLIIFGGIFLIANIGLAQYGVEETAGAAGIKEAGYGGDVMQIIANAIGTVLSFVGVLFFGLTLYGGFLWMTARGNQETEKSALDTIMGAVIGIIIVIGAYAITSFVFENVVGQGGATPKVNNPQTTVVPKIDDKKVVIGESTCSDGEKNGNETGIDCGGNCEICVTDKTCCKYVKDDFSVISCKEINCETSQCQTMCDSSLPSGARGALVVEKTLCSDVGDC